MSCRQGQFRASADVRDVARIAASYGFDAIVGGEVTGMRRIARRFYSAARSVPRRNPGPCKQQARATKRHPPHRSMRVASSSATYVAPQGAETGQRRLLELTDVDRRHVTGRLRHHLLSDDRRSRAGLAADRRPHVAQP